MMTSHLCAIQKLLTRLNDSDINGLRIQGELKLILRKKQIGYIIRRGIYWEFLSNDEYDKEKLIEMKVKVGNKVYDGNKVPVMVILTDQDKENIKNMHEDCTKYAMFPNQLWDKDEKLEWMHDLPADEEKPVKL